MHIRRLLVAACTIYSVSCEDYEYDDEISAPAPPQKVAPPAPRGLPSALQRSARGPVIGRPQPKSLTKSTTTTAQPEPPAAEEYDEEDQSLVEEDNESQSQTTTTEAPKKGKGGLKGGVVRPFRSNTDLLETLKRRRAQVGSNHGQVVSTTTTQPTPTPSSDKTYKSNSNGRRNKIADQTGSDSNRKSATTQSQPGASRRFSPRGQASVSQEVATSSEEAQTTRSARLFAGRGRKF
ncbi:uncharacterized protein LOC111048166 isoform X2 [Nilaparvata lugens]|uniref:uncharacterized protein LOC111048166 isoform X2 n=1 Tax=Nilaparvata lugens TaxID=108931 RepID=UPI00193D83E6|nr:uncharacterized protein LOC111048166 isoform X2 [Nilaparvata lugens]